MASSLPQEVKGEIMSYLGTDIEGLKACSLALRGYLSCCQTLLFSKIILVGAQGKAHKLRSLLASSPHLAAYVRCIKIMDYPHQDWPSEDTSLLSVLPLLRNLSSFYLHCRAETWLRMSQGLIDRLSDVMRLPYLTHIDITGVPLHFLDSGVNLKHLSSPGPVIISPPPTFPQDPAQEPIYLETLNVLPVNIVDMVDWFLSPENKLSLSRLKKLNASHDQGRVYLEQVSRILDVCRDTLEEYAFEPYIRTYSTPSPSLDSQDLTRLVALRALHVRVHFTNEYPGEEFSCNPLPWYVRHIERLLPSNTIENITIHLIIAGQVNYLKNGAFDWSSWQTLSTVLLKTLSRLRSVNLGIYCDDKIDCSLFVSNILRYTTDLQDAGIFRLEEMSSPYGDFCLCFSDPAWR